MCKLLSGLPEAYFYFLNLPNDDNQLKLFPSFHQYRRTYATDQLKHRNQLCRCTQLCTYDSE